MITCRDYFVNDNNVCDYFVKITCRDYFVNEHISGLLCKRFNVATNLSVLTHHVYSVSLITCHDYVVKDDMLGILVNDYFLNDDVNLSQLLYQ